MPNFCIFRVQKVKGHGAGRAHINALQKEHCRTSADQEAMAEKNPDIDWTKTTENYNLCRMDGSAYPGDTGENWNKVIDERLKELGIRPRKDAVRLLDSFYGASPEWFADKSEDEIDAYFSACCDFHEKYYGEIVSARVHWDEATPHIQIASIPLIDGKLSAKKLIGNRADLSKRQTDFFLEVGQRFGMDRGIVNEPGKARKHQKLAEFKQNQEVKKYAELRRDIKSLVHGVTDFARKAPRRLEKIYTSTGIAKRAAEKEWENEAIKIEESARVLDTRLGDSLGIDKDWNLMSEFEREELETKAMLRDI